MEIRVLKTFIKVAGLSSFSKAAMELGYNQSTVTLQIKSLESELDTRLFDRVNKTVKLTDKGRILLKYAQKIIAHEEEALEELEENNDITGEINIGAFESIICTFLPKILREYHQIYPNVNINIASEVFSDLENSLNTNIIDVLWFYDHILPRPDWKKVMINDYELVVVASTSHPLAKLKKVTSKMLEDEMFILGDKYCRYRRFFEESFKDNSFKINAMIEINNTPIIKQFIASGLGLGILPSYMVKSEIERGEIVILNVEGYSLTLSAQLYYHSDKWVSPAMKAFFELCKKMEY